MAPVALALCLCTTVLLSTPPPAQSSPPSPSPAAAEPTPSSEYKTYIILLKPRADAQVMDDEARQGWARLDNDDDYAVQDILQDLNLNCRNVPHLSDVDLNYPSIMVPANTTVRRTLTNMGPAEQYTGRLSMAHDVGVDFSPKSLSFSRPGEKLTFQVSHHGSEVAEGFLIWESNTHTVQSPLVVVRS
uniref:Subtilisin-like protease fibronectin type-III domain-containing protein n=1 Tax=Aegilops tauschii TaxID=37682 RepID=R7W9Q2_AEGTA